MGGQQSCLPFDGAFPESQKFISFSNLGNSCYMNSVLQAILNSKYFILFFENLHTTLKNIDLSDEDKDSLLYNLLCIYRIRKSQKEQTHVISPKLFHENLIKAGIGFTRGRQSDAHELYVALLDNFDNQINKFNSTYKLNIPLFSSLSHARSESCSQCLCCGAESNSSESFVTFFLGIKNKTSLTDRLRALQSPEYLSGAGKRECTICKISQEKRVMTTYPEIPNVLVFQIQRFEYDKVNQQLKKLKNVIPFPSSLVFCDRHYKLSSVIVHIGESLESGHFVALLRVDEKWVLANDANLILMSEVEVEEYFTRGKVPGQSFTSAYLLFYDFIENE